MHDVQGTEWLENSFHWYLGTMQTNDGATELAPLLEQKGISRYFLDSSPVVEFPIIRHTPISKDRGQTIFPLARH
jgi:hypothetical protein